MRIRPTPQRPIRSKPPRHAILFDGARVESPLIVPPTWSKGEHHKILQVVWQHAAQHLSEAERIIVIGYSLPESDLFFRFLYGLGTIGDHPLRQFLLIDPIPDVKRKFDELLGVAARRRFQFVGSTFGQALGELLQTNCFSNETRSRIKVKTLWGTSSFKTALPFQGDASTRRSAGSPERDPWVVIDSPAVLSEVIKNMLHFFG
jgi:hypothetical protein